MKRFFIGMMVVVMLALAPTVTHAVTIAELQAMIAQLTTQLNVLLAQQNNPTNITTPSWDNNISTSTGYASFVEKPTLKLVYDRYRNESRLEASAIVAVDVGTKDILIGSLELAIKDGAGVGFNTRGQNFSVTVISGATPSQDMSYKAWLVKAGTKAIFKITKTENPQMLFAGTYTTSLYPVSIFVKDGAGNLGSAGFAYDNSKSLPVTIVGEKSPYISGVDYTPTQIILTGVRFSKGDKVYVNNVYKGTLAKLEGATRTAISSSWLEKSEKGECMLYGSVQIENVKYGKSNSFGVSKGCEGTTTQPSITIISPNGGGYYKKNSPIKVTWTTNIPKTEYLNVIRLRAYTNGQEYNLADNVLNTGETNLTIPSDVPAGAYKLEIKTYTKGYGVLVTDASDSYFNITDSTFIPTTQTPSITVLSPNGGELLGAGKTILVKWTSKNLSDLSINIDLINKDGSSVRLASSRTNTGSYQGQLPIDLRDGYYKLLVSTNDRGSSALDYSDDYFMTINESSIQSVVSQKDKAKLNISYDSSKKEVALNASQQFSVTAGGGDFYVVAGNIKIDRIGGENVISRGVWIPNGTSGTFGGLRNTTKKNFIDPSGVNQTGWLVKAGQTATFESKMHMNPQLMYSGVYTAELNYVSTYSNGNYREAVWKGDSMPSDSVTIIGERVSQTSVIPSTNIEANRIDKLNSVANALQAIKEMLKVK